MEKSPLTSKLQHLTATVFAGSETAGQSQAAKQLDKARQQQALH